MSLWKSTMLPSGSSADGVGVRPGIALRALWFGCLLVAGTCLFSADALAAKTDIVTLLNGDRITGEVKALQHGRLRYSTDSMGTIYIEWKDILGVASQEYHRVELVDGTRFFGSLDTDEETGELVVKRTTREKRAELIRVVKVDPIEQKVIDRFDATVSAGYDFTKASDVTRITAGLDVVYSDETWRYGLRFNSVITDDGDDRTKNNRLQATAIKLRTSRWFTYGLGNAEQNDELGLDLRLLGSVGLGRFMRQTNTHELITYFGPAVTYEESADGQTNTDLEAALGLQFAIFKYDTPETNLTTSLQFFPGVSDFGRLRGQWDINFRKELVEDFFWNLNWYSTYDSDPRDEDAASTDYGINTGLGWEFW
jgi:putative salt-induced outer membrane protein YdiY